MAKEPTATRKSPQQIEAMAEEVRAYRAEEAAAANAAAREAGKPLFDMAESDATKTVRDMLPALDRLAFEQRDLFPNLDIYVRALRSGFDGIDILAPRISDTGTAADAATT